MTPRPARNWSLARTWCNGERNSRRRGATDLAPARTALTNGVFKGAGAHLPAELVNRADAQADQPGSLDDTGALGEFGAGSLKLFLLGARAAKVAADDARLPADELAVAGQRFNDAGADLALIGAAQKVEHYEIAGYTTAWNLAQQLKMPALVQLPQLTLAEEENADQLLNQVARRLMSVARMPDVIEKSDNGRATPPA